MKLYAKTTSERASKGQGGKYLDIQIYDENKKELMRLYVTNSSGVNAIEVFEENQKLLHRTYKVSKGKQKKDETHAKGCCGDHSSHTHLGCCNEGKE